MQGVSGEAGLKSKDFVGVAVARRPAPAEPRFVRPRRAVRHDGSEHEQTGEEAHLCGKSALKDAYDACLPADDALDSGASLHAENNAQASVCLEGDWRHAPKEEASAEVIEQAIVRAAESERCEVVPMVREPVLAAPAVERRAEVGAADADAQLISERSIPSETSGVVARAQRASEEHRDFTGRDPRAAQHAPVEAIEVREHEPARVLRRRLFCEAGWLCYASLGLSQDHGREREYEGHER
jgi:hypothetical protein